MFKVFFSVYSSHCPCIEGRVDRSSGGRTHVVRLMVCGLLTVVELGQAFRSDMRALTGSRGVMRHWAPKVP